MATTVASPATRLPGPPEVLPGRPDAIVDLQTDEGVALVGGQWRYSDAQVEEIDFVELGSPEDPLGPGTVPNRTYDVIPHARGGDFDDSAGSLAPADTLFRLVDGPRVLQLVPDRVTIPERIGDSTRPASTVVFEVVIDDYAEVWVNGELPVALGDTGGRSVGRLQRAQPRRAHPRRAAGRPFADRRLRHQRPDLGLAARTTSGCARRRSTSTRRARTSPRPSSGRARASAVERVDRRLRVHRGPGLARGRRAALLLAEHQRDLPLDPEDGG